MRLSLFNFFVFFILLNNSSIKAQNGVSIIPLPSHIEVSNGTFCLNLAEIILPSDKQAKKLADYLADAVLKQCNVDLFQTTGKNKIIFQYCDKIKNPEGYQILISRNKIRFTAANDTGLFRAIQSFRQLLPVVPEGQIFLPCMQVIDEPIYRWRSNMLDVSRHFFSVDYLKKHIDMLAYYKYNFFHWHLTDDQGWRIEIKKYPELTRTGAYRIESDGSVYGGYYTQQEISEVIEYARQRYITIIPEIEMPGHCLAALASYPELSCRKIQFSVPNNWGVFNDVYCAGNEQTYLFIEDVLEEVLKLFPSKYIHIGGDEVPKYRWQNCSDCQKKITTGHLKNEEGLQSYFITRIQNYLKSHNRVMIGWDEILEGGISSDAIVEVWRGKEKEQEALKNGNKIIQTLYFDAPPDVLGIKKTLNYKPSDSKYNKFVFGAECPLWTENITEFNADYMLYPRIQAFSEALWNGNTTEMDFRLRLKKHYTLMDNLKIYYSKESKPFFYVTLKFIPDIKAWRLFEIHENNNVKIHFTSDGSVPVLESKIFTDSLTILNPQLLTVAAIRDDSVTSLPVRFSIVENTITGKTPVFSTPCNEKYNKGGIYGMTDGITGSMNFADGTWMGWWGEDVNFFVDLGFQKEINFIQINFMQQVQSWILLPNKVEFFISDDMKNWKQIASLSHNISEKNTTPQVYQFSYQLPETIKASYLKVNAVNFGQLPAWHIGAGGNSWLFADELIVR